MSSKKTALTEQPLQFPGSVAQSIQRLLAGTGSGVQTNKIIGVGGGGGGAGGGPATNGATTATAVVTTLYEISVTADDIAASGSPSDALSLAVSLQTLWLIVICPEDSEEFRQPFTNMGTAHQLPEDVAQAAWNALSCGNYPKKLRLVG